MYSLNLTRWTKLTELNTKKNLQMGFFPKWVYFVNLFANILFSKIFRNPLNIWKTWNIERSSALQLFWATVDSSLVDNINIAPQRPVKCFHNLVKKFDFNLIISNPKGSSNVKLVVTLETCTASQKARTKRQQKH